MENYSYSSYADSHDSSPRSRDNESWDDQQPRTPPPPHASNYKVKFMCSYGGKIQPRPHDNQLTYVGGETKILSVDRNVKFSTIISKLSSFVSDLSNDTSTCFKYQLPGEDLDALISVTNDEDLDHMMMEYDRLYRSAGSRPARLRIFLFPVSCSNPGSNRSSLSFSGEGDSAKPNQQWFVDALNSVPIQSLEEKTNVSNADFLFGFEQQHQQQHQQQQQILTPTKSTQEAKNPIESDYDRSSTGGDSLHEMQRQIHELQKLQISNQEQQQQQQAQAAAMFQRRNEENLNLSRQLNPYWQQEQQQHQVAAVRGGYSDQIAGTEPQRHQQVYMVPSQPPATAMFQTSAAGVRQVTGQMGHPGQGYYGMQRVVPEVYREQPVYTMGPPQAQPQPQPQQAKMMMGEGGGYTTQVAYDGNGRQQLFYTTNTNATVPSSYPTAVATASADPRQSGPLSQEGKPVKLQQA